jgi:predicted translin family RNA/ssDNA-binding protein
MSIASDLKKVRDRYIRLQRTRIELQQVASAAQRRSKQAIFAMQRGEASLALKILDQVENSLQAASKLVSKEEKLQNDGMWRSALEEFTEASFFCKAAQGVKIFPPHRLTDDPEILIGGLSDMIGELVRLAVQAATERDIKRVERIHAIAEQSVSFLLSLDAIGNTRQKVDQARQHLRRLEDVRYDLSKSV